MAGMSPVRGLSLALSWLSLVVLVPVGLFSLLAAVVSGIFLVATGFVLAMMLGLSAILLAVLKLPPLKLNLPRRNVVPEPIVEIFKRDPKRE